MKQLIWKIVLPTTVIIFSTITMWHHVLLENGTDEVFFGFPFPYVGIGWHTSLSYQLFIGEFVFDFLIYFALCFLLVYLINRFIIKIKLSRKIVIALYVISAVLIIDPKFIIGINDHIYKMKQDFNTKTLEKGIKFRFCTNMLPNRSSEFGTLCDFSIFLTFANNDAIYTPAKKEIS